MYSMYVYPFASLVPDEDDDDDDDDVNEWYLSYPGRQLFQKV